MTGPRQQRGIALVVALVMLVVLTLIGIGASRISIADERSARVARDREVARQAAEAALRDAMADIDTGLRNGLMAQAPIGFVDGCPSVSLPSGPTAAAQNRRGMCLARASDSTRQLWQDADLAGQAVPFGTFTSRSWDTSQSPAPVYLIESLPLRRAGTAVDGTASQPDQLAFRITAVGFGPTNSNVEVALQSYYVRTL